MIFHDIVLNIFNIRANILLYNIWMFMYICRTIICKLCMLVLYNFVESLPVCESNLTENNSHSLIDGDHIWIECNINFRGFWAPSMEWIQHGGDFGPEGK